MGSDKITRKCHTQESQDLSPFPADAQMGARNSESSMMKITRTKADKKDPQKKHHLGAVSKSVTGEFKHA